MGETSQRNIPLKWIKQESEENYMKAIYVLGFRRSKGVRYMELEDYFGFSKASVCKAVQALREEGFVTIDPSYNIWLTEKGVLLSEAIYKKYQFFRRMLIRAGVDPKQAEAEACKLEHGISDGSLVSLVSNYADAIPESQ